MNWKIRLPRTLRFASAGILHPSALEIALGLRPRAISRASGCKIPASANLSILGGVFSNTSLLSAVYYYNTLFRWDHCHDCYSSYSYGKGSCIELHPCDTSTSLSRTWFDMIIWRISTRQCCCGIEHPLSYQRSRLPCSVCWPSRRWEPLICGGHTKSGIPHLVRTNSGIPHSVHTNSGIPQLVCNKPGPPSDLRFWSSILQISSASTSVRPSVYPTSRPNVISENISCVL